MSDSLWPHGLYSPWNFPGQNIRVDNLSFLQGNFPTQGSNPCLPHSRWILYQLSHKGSLCILIRYHQFTMINKSYPWMYLTFNIQVWQKPECNGEEKKFFPFFFSSDKSVKLHLRCSLRKGVKPVYYQKLGCHSWVSLFLNFFGVYLNVKLISKAKKKFNSILLKYSLLLSHFSRVRLCATP